MSSLKADPEKIRQVVHYQIWKKSSLVTKANAVEEVAELVARLFERDETETVEEYETRLEKYRLSISEESAMEQEKGEKRDNREFRELNERERKCITFAFLDRKGRLDSDTLVYVHREDLRVSYEQMQGGFTVCVLVLERYGEDLEPQVLIWRGVSRRSHKDRPNPVRGEMRAFSRAVLYSRAVEV